MSLADFATTLDISADFSVESPAPGRFQSVPEADYFAAPALNASTLKHMGRSALHCKAEMARPSDQPETEAKRVGHLIHCALLEPERFRASYRQLPDPADHPEALVDHAAYKAKAKALKLKVTGTKAALKARILEAAPDTPFWEDLSVELLGEREGLKADHWFMAQSVLESVAANPKAASALSGGTAEETFVWQDELTGLLSKGRFDYYREDLGVIFDVKTTMDASPSSVSRDIYKWGYHVSAAHYLAGLKALGLPGGTFAWVFVEKSPPYAIGLYMATPEMLAKGEEQRVAYLTQFARCKLSGIWPGYSGEFQPVELPTWA